MPRRDVIGVDSKPYPKVPVELSNLIWGSTLGFLKRLLHTVEKTQRTW